jgi:eukaryotic-like serine/threonine-protein kinase
VIPSNSPGESVPDEARYVIGRAIGHGSAGSVYLATDRETGEQVALKKLLRFDQKSVLRLKREFRSIANIHHPNLVKLYDLGRASDGWFLTMEHIDGPDLLTYLEPDRNSIATRMRGQSNAPPALNHERLLSAFHQLACGVHALHRSGMLHRDLKPSNVLVAQGRVVVLDFGLVRELDEDSKLVTVDDTVSGTPAYMPPEQAMGLELSEVSDWYAVGVMLYQVLSGRLPIDGRNANELIGRKLDLDPTPLDTLGLQLPQRLTDLCMGLLRREPAERPRGDAVLAAFEAGSQSIVPYDSRSFPGDLSLQTETQRRSITAPLFGRQRELLQLRAAVEQARQDGAVVAHVRGPSGAGKSALVEHFLEQLELERDTSYRASTLVLRSRCYEREAMPFKALDGVMDALVRHLSRLDDFDVARSLPAEVAELAQLFPALERLRAVQRLLVSTKPRGDALQVRRRAEAALRDLFARLAANNLLVLWIDDLQWGDLDSATVLRNWLQQTMRAPVLLVLSYRSEELATSSCLRVLLARDGVLPPVLAAEHTIDLSPMADADVETLCNQRLGAAGSGSTRPALVERIVSESQGNPFLASQLTALAQAKLARSDTDLNALSIEQLVTQASALLPDEARAILNVLAIAGRPILPQLALRAASVKREGRAHLHALQGLRLMRTRNIAGERWLEVYHDRVREAVNGSLDLAARERVHDALLRALEIAGNSDVDWLHTLSMGAAQRVPALRYGLLAAERASASLAFERAAELYQTCIELTDPAADSGELWSKLALALARCRRGVKAAEAYLEAAKHVSAEQAIPWLRLAASHLLRSGRFEQGEALVRQVLDALSLAVPESESGLLAAIAWERVRLAARGMGYTARAIADVPETLIAKVQLFGSLSIETLAYDPVRAALFQARSLRWSLESGEVSYVARAWCIAAMTTCVSGSARAALRTEDLLDRAETLSRQPGLERLHGFVCASRAVCNLLLGRPAAVLAPSYEAERIYGADSAGDEQGEYYHLFSVMAARIAALYTLGEYRRFLVELQNSLDQARVTDNRSAVLHLSLVQTVAEQVQDQAAKSRPRLDEQRNQLPKGRLGLLQIMHMAAVMRAACSTGEHEWALSSIEHDWERYLRSPVHASAFIAFVTHAAHARLLLNRHVLERDKRDPAELLRRDLRVLTKSPFMHWGAGASQRMNARMAYLRGELETAAALFSKSAAAYDLAGSADEAARDRYALGFVLGGAAGNELRVAADALLRERGVVNPLADLRGFYPELLR